MNVGTRLRSCCHSRRGNSHLADCTLDPIPQPDLANLRARTVVPGALKCQECGASVLTTDPLPHRCSRWAHSNTVEYGRYAL